MFPNYKTIKKKFLFIKYNESIPDGWEDLGYTNSIIDRCPFCADKVKIGKENGVVFNFCERCLIKLFRIKD